ncbi:hypothetical protein Tco_1456958 [Tanacetum coccineum]
MVPRTLLMKSGLVSLNTAIQVNTAHPKITMNSARPMTNLSKSAHSTVKWPIPQEYNLKSNFNQRVNTVKDKKFNTARPKEVVNGARPKGVVNAVKGNKEDESIEVDEVVNIKEYKSHPLEQVIENLNQRTYLAFRGNAHDLGSFGEETEKTTDIHQHFSRLCSQDARDAVTIHPMTMSQESMTASARTIV